MLAIKPMDMRDNFKAYCEKVILGETIIVSRKNNENIVILSEKEYNEIIKNKKNTEYNKKIEMSLKEIESKNTITFDIEQLEAMENMSSDEAKKFVDDIRKKQGKTI